MANCRLCGEWHRGIDTGTCLRNIERQVKGARAEKMEKINGVLVIWDWKTWIFHKFVAPFFRQQIKDLFDDVVYPPVTEWKSFWAAELGQHIDDMEAK